MIGQIERVEMMDTESNEDIRTLATMVIEGAFVDLRRNRRMIDSGRAAHQSVALRISSLMRARRETIADVEFFHSPRFFFWCSARTYLDIDMVEEIRTRFMREAGETMRALDDRLEQLGVPLPDLMDAPALGRYLN